MSEEETQDSVIEETAPPTESAEQPALQEQSVQAQERQISDQEYNWNEARKRMRELERRAEEQDDLIQRLQGQREQQPLEDDLSKLSDDDIVTAKQAKILAKKMARQVAEETFKEREAATVDERVKSKYPDFENVVTRESIELLKQQDPELAQSLYALAQDPYAQAIAAYKMLRKQGIGEVATQHPSKARAIENAKKPVSVQAVGKSSAIGNVSRFENGLSQDEKDALYLEMRECARRM